MSLGYSIRLYELLPDGRLEALGGGPLKRFGGSCPNVGDAIARYSYAEEVFQFYNVQRRMFIDSLDGDEGWAIVIRRTEPSPLMADVATEWVSETKFWRDVDEQERREEHELAERAPGTVEWSMRQRNERAKLAPKLGLNGPELRILRYMISHRRHKTLDRIPDAGPRRIKKLEELGLVQPGGIDTRGKQEWLITKAGREEVKRGDAYNNWKRE